MITMTNNSLNIDRASERVRNPSLQIPSIWTHFFFSGSEIKSRLSSPFLSFFVSSFFKCWEVSECYGGRKITAHKIPKEVNPGPCWGIYTRAMKNGCLADYITCSHCSLCGLLKRFILNCSIFKVTAWFHIHNHSCMNVQFHFSP